MSACLICPRRCGADRQNGFAGYCGQTSVLKVARASLHRWEEPCISGERGSGTVFFAGCSLRCVFCQNYEISMEKNGGKQMSEAELAELFLKLEQAGAHNINLVTPTHFVSNIVSALSRVKNRLKIPVVYNTSGYELVNTLKMLDGLVDVYLPDFKYMDSETAAKYSNAPDYPEIAKDALAEMVRQKPHPCFNEDKIMTSGVLVRNLLLPGSLKNSKNVINYVYSSYGDDVYISIMNQYTPVVKNTKYKELNFCTTRREYEKLVDYAVSIGIKNAYIQSTESSSELYIPKFGKDSIILDF